MPWFGGAHRSETPPCFRVQSLWSRAVKSPCIARGLFSDGEEPYDRRLLPARLPVGGGDRVLIVQDSQALEGFEQLVTLVAEVLALHAPPVEVAMAGAALAPGPDP